MKSFNIIIASLALLFSVVNVAQSAPARSTLLDDAAARVVMQSKEAGATWKGDSERYVNHIEPGAELIKYTR
ncbi:hypothetical protein [Pantoea phytobeneficialis]|uniref:DUF1471 domain-containing protein n=1 Tax=Pantoea phytobeneficialis TaxID=2052056 RepID=A0AAP9H5J3_9GAMM|nr:hypothetical protein [Pantoea phytobeneficialis]MDO6405610.1 hypothetical protein [Pantoea phytobeneficialis]QGR06744.1 hypothetical protein CTZ24_10105 [Pantoea phytobeneficialis]